MLHSFVRRAAPILIYLLFALGLAWGVYSWGYASALVPLRERGEADLALTADRLTGELQRYQDLAVLMARHPDLARLIGMELRDPGSRQRANQLLLEAADRTTALNLAYFSPRGQLLAEARPLDLPQQSLVAFRDGAIFQRALTGALGEGIGLYPPRGVRSYIFAAPTFSPGGGVTGVLVVAVDIDHLENVWRGERPAVFFTDRRSQVFITNRSEFLYWQFGREALQPPEGAPVPVEVQTLSGMQVWRAEMSAYVPNPALHLVRDLPQVSMTASALIDVAPAQRLAGLQAALAALVVLAFGAFFYWATERRQVLARSNAQLETRVAERTAELSGANLALRREVAERQEAEAALKKAQADLVQAGKLSALGQMSAGISHELNQPLMAIGQFAENGALLLERGKTEAAAGNLDRIAQLSGRMGRIIRNLRAFARQESEPVRRIDVVTVVETALEMTEARLAKDGIALDWVRPKGPVFALGGDVRLAQVLVNLITNAADAMSGAGERRLGLSVSGDPVPTIRVTDTGPGIAQPERIFDPFYSTKEVGAGEGMGLGLSISYGLVQSFGGVIRGRNRAEAGGPSGAEFTVELEPWRGKGAPGVVDV